MIFFFLSFSFFQISLNMLNMLKKVIYYFFNITFIMKK